MNFYWENFKELRKKNKLPVTYVISKLNICRRTFWAWENGKITPNEHMIRTLAKIIGVPVSLISDLKEEVETSKITPLEIASNITEVINKKDNIVFDSIINIVTQLKKKNQQSEVLLKALLSSNNVMFYVKDLQLRYITANEIFFKTLSFEPNFSCMGKNDEVFFSGEEAKKNTAEDENVLITGVPVTNREDFIPGTRKKKWGLISKYPIFEENKKIIGVVGTFIDITELSIKERKRILLEQLIDVFPLGISISHEKEEIQKKSFYVNFAYANMVGLERDVFIKNPEIRWTLAYPDDIEIIYDFINKEEYPKSTSFRILKGAEKKVCWVRYSTYKIDSYIVSTVEDIARDVENEEIKDLLKIYASILKRSMTILDIDTHQYLYINEAKEKLYERKAEEFYKNGPDFWLNGCIHEKDRRKFRTYIEDLTARLKYDQNKPNIKYRIITPDGKIKLVCCETTFTEFKGKNCSLYVEVEIPVENQQQYTKKQKVKTK